MGVEGVVYYSVSTGVLKEGGVRCLQNSGDHGFDPFMGNGDGPVNRETRACCDKSIRKSSSPDFPWCCIVAESGFREIQLVQVRALAADADAPQLGLTAVQVSLDSLGAELRPGRRLVAKFWA